MLLLTKIFNQGEGQMLTFKNDGQGGFAPTSTPGRAPFGENVVYISQHILDRVEAKEGEPFAGTGKTNLGQATLERTGPHEVGHSADLRHPPKGTAPGNLMNQTIEPDAGTDINTKDILKMEKSHNEGKTNKGKQKD